VARRGKYLFLQMCIIRECRKSTGRRWKKNTAIIKQVEKRLFRELVLILCEDYQVVPKTFKGVRIYSTKVQSDDCQPLDS